MATTIVSDPERGRQICMPVALWHQLPSDIAGRIEIEFETHDDDLGAFDGAALKIQESGLRFGIRRYRNAPYRGSEILLSEESRDPSSELDAIVQAIDIPSGQIEVIK